MWDDDEEENLVAKTNAKISREYEAEAMKQFRVRQYPKALHSFNKINVNDVMSLKDSLESQLDDTIDDEEKLYSGKDDLYIDKGHAPEAPKSNDVKADRKKSAVKKLKSGEQTTEIFLHQGLQEMKHGNHTTAMKWFNRALHYCPNNKMSLAYRSRCHLLLGENDKALQDIEAAMKEDRYSVPSLIQKAETLFRMGDFEEALMYNHRGLKLKSDCQAFKMGIRNCQVAIKNAAGASAPFDVIGTEVTEEQIKEVLETKTTKGFTGTFSQHSLKPGAIVPPPEATSNKIAKLILGRAAVDRTFLKESILQNKELSTSDKASSIKICKIAQNTLNYLQTKQEFLRKQQPIYSRVDHGKLRYRPLKKLPGDSAGKEKENEEVIEECPENVVRGLKNSLADIYGAMNAQYYHTALQWSCQTMELMNEHMHQEMPEKYKILTTINNQLGTCCLALGDYDDAVKYFKRNVEISDEKNLPLAKSIALENLGKAYALLGKYHHAIQAWEQKMPLCQELLEQTWLHHELGRAYLELGKFDKAKSHGEQSLTLAKKGDDIVWKLNSTLLVAQAHMQSGEFEKGEKLFRKSIGYSRCIGDNAVTEAILNVLSICESRGLRSEDDEPSLSASFTSSSEPAPGPENAELDTEASSVTSDEN